MSTNNTFILKNELTGALIGLARVCSNNPKTENSDRIMIEGLVATVLYSELSDNDLKILIDRVIVEKYLVSPGCSTCIAKCGNTDNYDMGKLWDANDEIRSLKLSILFGIQNMANFVQTNDIEKNDYDEVIEFMYKALYVLAEDWSSDEFYKIVLEMGNLFPKCMNSIK